MALCKRLDGSTMANHSTLPAGDTPSGAASHLSAAGYRRHSLCCQDWLPMADATIQFSQLEYGLRDFLAMAERRSLAEASRCAAGKSTPTRRQETNAYGSHYRQPVGTHGRRRRGTRIRCRQEDSRSKAASCRGYPWLDFSGYGPLCRLARSRRGVLGIGTTQGELPSL